LETEKVDMRMSCPHGSLDRKEQLTRDQKDREDS